MTKNIMFILLIILASTAVDGVHMMRQNFDYIFKHVNDRLFINDNVELMQSVRQGMQASLEP